MKDKLGFAIIGCGRISSKHVEGVINNYQEARLVAVSDLVEEKMDESIEFYNNYLNENNLETSTDELEELKNNRIKKYNDYRELLENEDIDVVTIATESGYHPEIAIEALKADKHVIVEKPMALSIADADKMIEVAEERNLKLSVCHQNRFNPTIQELRSALEEDRFGKLVHAVASVRWNRNEAYFNMDDWHGTLALDGGILMNQCIH